MLWYHSSAAAVVVLERDNSSTAGHEAEPLGGIKSPSSRINAEDHYKKPTPSPGLGTLNHPQTIAL